MQSARDKLARAQRAMGSRDYEDARRLAEQAEVDARLAESKVAATRSEQALSELQESIRELNREIERRSAVPVAPASTGAMPAQPIGAPVGAPAGTPVGTSVVTPAAPLAPARPLPR